MSPDLAGPAESGDDLQRRFVRELALVLEPVMDAAALSDGQSLLHELGWDATGTTGFPAEDLEEALTAIVDAYERLRAAAENATGDLASTKLLVSLCGDAFSVLRAIGRIGGESFPKPDAFERIGIDLVEFLFVRYLASHHAVAYELAALFCLLEPLSREGVVDETGLVRVSHTSPTLRLSRVSRLLSDPLAFLKEAYFPPGALATDDDAARTAETLFGRLAAVMAAAGVEAAPPATRADNWSSDPAALELARGMLSIAFRPDLGPDAEDSTIGFTLALSSERDGGAGIVVVPTVSPHFGHNLGGWRLEVAATAGVGAVAVRSTGTVIAGEGADATVEARIRLVKLPVEGLALRVGSMKGTRIELEGLSIVAAAAIGADTGSFSVQSDATAGGFVLASGDGDGFIRMVLPRDGLRIGFDAGAVWDPVRGLRLRGAAGLNATYILALDVLGVLHVDALQLSVRPEENGIAAEAAIAVRLRLGPVEAALDRVGFTGTVAFPPDGGNAGPAEVDIAFRHPTGAGLTVKSPVVEGGGYLAGDIPAGRYSGALQLRSGDVAINAVGLITTDAKGFSLVVLMSARGFTPVPLGFGFSLTGIGGLVAVNRTIAVNSLAKGLQSGSLDSLLFPTDVATSGPRVVADLERYFPAAPEQFVVGPMVEIKWGEGGILRALIAVLIEFPAPTRVALAGRVRLALPSTKTASVDVRLDVLGSLDLSAKTVAIDAVLRNSRIGPFTLTGDAAVRASWGDPPAFLLAIGGFHPRYEVPQGFPALRRVALSLGESDNPRLRLEAYLALTSNTVQLGARLDLYAAADIPGAGTFAVAALLSFDTLVELDPFGFRVDIAAMVALTWNGSPFLGVSLELTLTGPQPWHAVGRATFDFFGRHSIPFDVTVGEDAAVATTPTITVLPQLVAALARASSWSAELPSSVPNLVMFVAAAPTDAILVHPLGRLVAKQRIVPLGLELARVGAARVVDDGSHTFSIATTSLGAPETVTDYFAPAQFRDLTDDEKLAQPSFEQLAAGVRVGPPATKAPPVSAWRSPDVELETTIAATGQILGGTLASERVLAQVGASAAAVCGASARGARAYASEPRGVAVLAPTYAVADSTRLAPVATESPRIATYAQAADARRSQPDRDALTILETSDVFATPEQESLPAIDPARYYALIAVHSDKSAEVQADSLEQGARVQQWTQHAHGNQFWQLRARGDGTYLIRCEHSQQLLDVAGIGKANGSAIQQWPEVDGGGVNQRWRLRSLGRGTYRIESYNGGRCLTVAGGPDATSDGAGLELWDWWGGANQRWRLVAVAGGKSLHQQIEEAAYAHWRGRGSPLWSAQQDWVAAEHAVLDPYVRVEAYLAWERGGRHVGDALKHWLAAETEVKRRVREGD